jgi:F-type H+-transporting ATPase subunit a
MIPLGSEKLFSILNFRITDTVTSTLLTDIVALLLVFIIYKSISLRPGKLQNIIEIVVEYLYSMTKEVAGSRTGAIFTWFMSFFLFIVIANLLGLVPGYTSLGMMEEGKLVPFFRTPTSDLNLTLALAMVSLVATHVLSLKFIGLKKYLKHFFSWSPILLFIGLLEIMSELTKIISFSFRLFGNIFAGEVVLTRVASIMPWVAPLPFILLELIVAVVQAFIFAMLTMVFMSMFTAAESEGGGH